MFGMYVLLHENWIDNEDESDKYVEVSKRYIRNDVDIMDLPNNE